MSDMKHQITVFISTGEKYAMYTLRTVRFSFSKDFSFHREAYIKNLSTDLEKATKLAEEYTNNLRERLSINCAETEVFFAGHDVDELEKRRGKLSVEDTRAIEDIERGIVPFGKHKDKKIVDLDDNYLCWLTDQLTKDDLRPVFHALCSVASGIANDRGLLAKRQAERDQKHEEALKSTHFGEIGKRYVEDVEIVGKFEERYDGDLVQIKYVMKIGDQILFHNGRTDLPKGPCRIKFTVKFHNTTNNGVNKTYINRPSLEK